MITTRKSLKVSILGKSYSLATDENSEIVYQAAAMVDGLLNGNSAAIQAGALDKVAIVTALQLAADVIKMRNSLDEYEGKCKALIQLTNE